MTTGPKISLRAMVAELSMSHKTVGVTKNPRSMSLGGAPPVVIRSPSSRPRAM